MIMKNYYYNPYYIFRARYFRDVHISGRNNVYHISSASLQAGDSKLNLMDYEASEDEYMHKNGLHLIRPEYPTRLFVSLTNSYARVNDFIMETRGWYFKWIVTSASEVDYISRTNHSAPRVFAESLLKNPRLARPEIRDVTIIPRQTVNGTNATWFVNSANI